MARMKKKADIYDNLNERERSIMNDILKCEELRDILDSSIAAHDTLNTPSLSSSCQITPSTEAIDTPTYFQACSSTLAYDDYFSNTRSTPNAFSTSTILEKPQACHSIGNLAYALAVAIPRDTTLKGRTLLNGSEAASSSYQRRNSHHSGDNSNVMHETVPPSFLSAAVASLPVLDELTYNGSTPQFYSNYAQPTNKMLYFPTITQQQNCLPIANSKLHNAEKQNYAFVINQKSKKASNGMGNLTNLKPKDKKEECSICKRTFLRKNMKNHVKTHNKDRQKIKCNYHGCDKAYFYQRDLDRHEDYYHEGNTHLCIICYHEFDRKNKLAKHMQEHFTTLFN